MAAIDPAHCFQLRPNDAVKVGKVDTRIKSTCLLALPPSTTRLSTRAGILQSFTSPNIIPTAMTMSLAHPAHPLMASIWFNMRRMRLFVTSTNS